jgi:selenocysteine-specific elongation factor
VAPVLPASKARPDRSVERVVAERGWVDADELAALTGEQRTPTLGRWVTAPGVVDEMVGDLATRVAAAGDLGLDVATLDGRERAALALVDGIAVEAGRAKPAGQRDVLADHPFLAALEAGGVSPPAPEGVDRWQLRELVRRGLVVERDGLYFAPSAIDAAAAAAARLLTERPEGFTVAELRDALGATRKHVLPLANELDARGVTRRRGDLRIAGPRLPG